MDSYYTVKQVAEKANVHTDTVRKLVNSGKLEAVKFGGSVRISETAFNRYVEQFKTGKPLPPKLGAAKPKPNRAKRGGFKFL